MKLLVSLPPPGSVNTFLNAQALVHGTPAHTALNLAALRGFDEIVAILLGCAGIDLELGDQSLDTPLYNSLKARKRNAMQCVRMLLKKGANPFSRRKAFRKKRTSTSTSTSQSSPEKSDTRKPRAEEPTILNN